MKIFRFFIVAFILLYAHVLHAAELNISLDKNKAVEGEVVYLTISYNGKSNKSPDFTAIQEDFQIVSTSTSSSSSLINGVSSILKKWTIGLIPQSTGAIRIKPFELDGVISNSLQLNVYEVGDTVSVSGDINDDNYLKIDTYFNEKSPIVQQQLTFWVNIYDSIGLKDGEISISDDAKDDWIVKPLMLEPIISQRKINDVYFNVISFAYAIFPLKDGQQKLPQFTFDGYFVKNNDFNFPNIDGDFFGLTIDMNSVFGTKVPVKLKTKEDFVKVSPIKDHQNRLNWIVAEDLKIKSTLSIDKKIKVGDAFSRNVEIRLTGVPKNLFPDIYFEEINGLKQYPEKPEISEEIIDGKIVTKVIYNTAYIPTDSGEINLPKIEIDWYNSTTKKMQKSVSNSHNIDVLPNNNIVMKKEEKTVVLENNITEEFKEEKIDTPKEVSLEDKDQDTNKNKDSNLDINKIVQMVLGGFLFVLLFFFKKKTNNNNSIYRKNVIKAIENRDFRLAKQRIIEWARFKFNNPNIQNFKTISDIVGDEEFCEQLNSLNKTLYSSDGFLFESKKFIETFLKIDKMKMKLDKKTDILPDLYN